jgi:hypothetical protein
LSQAQRPANPIRSGLGDGKQQPFLELLWQQKKWCGHAVRDPWFWLAKQIAAAGKPANR